MIIRKINPTLTLSVVLSFLLLSACTFKVGKGAFGYNMKGVNIPSDCKTANVQYFENRASIVQPALAQDLTERLRDKILSDTPLKLTNGTGDINFTGTIVSYNTQPMAPQAGTDVTAALNRLTITVKVTYNNAKDSQWDYDQTFSRYIEYPSNLSLTEVERNEDYSKMLDLLVQDAFNQAFVNW